MIVIFCLRTKNSCRISKSTTLPQVTSDIITFSRMVRFSCVLPLWKAIELTIMPVLTVLKNIENWPFYSQSRKTGHFFWTPFMITLYTITPRYNHSIFMNILYGHCIYLYYHHSINNDIMTSLFMIILSSAYIYLYYYMTTLCMVILSLDHSISIQYSIF